MQFVPGVLTEGRLSRDNIRRHDIVRGGVIVRWGGELFGGEGNCPGDIVQKRDFILILIIIALAVLTE